MAKISTATVYFPGELTYAGTNAIHTAQKISMLKVINLASLKLSGSLRAKKASTKQTAASRPMYPSTREKASGEPTSHNRIIRAVS